MVAKTDVSGDANPERAVVPGWAKLLLLIQTKLIFDAPGSPRIKVANAVNLHKIFTVFIIYGMMLYTGNFTTGAWIYLALHGVYGYCWLIKDLGFRDHQLDRTTSWWGAVNMYLGLVAWYWLIPWLFLSRFIVPSPEFLAAIIALHTLGIVTMISADEQRHFTLKYKSGLFTGGLYAYTRNPNYLGEIMVYASYALLARHWIAWAIVGYAVFSTFLPRMYQKDFALSRHPGWAAYKAKTGLLIPWGLLNGRALFDRLGGKSEKA